MVVQVTPMDAHGFFNFSTTCSMTPTYCRKARKVVVEVNNYGGEAGTKRSTFLQVDMVVEGPN